LPAPPRVSTTPITRPPSRERQRNPSILLGAQQPVDRLLSAQKVAGIGEVGEGIDAVGHITG
ncbi:hypothetical protein, partial [Brevibacterium marinum]|uniref:hypothetical protein n=1 Tax=Brevibacterium marinum TaxID=418643 RepID=UPI0031D430AC